MFQLTISPEQKSTSAPGWMTLSRMDTLGAAHTLWHRKIRRIPAGALVSDDGAHVVTIGLWGPSRMRDNVLNIYGPAADSVRALSLGEFLPRPVLNRVWSSVSAVHWGHRGIIDLEAQELKLSVWAGGPPEPAPGGGWKPMAIDSAFVRIRLEDGAVVTDSEDMRGIIVDPEEDFLDPYTPVAPSPSLGAKAVRVKAFIDSDGRVRETKIEVSAGAELDSAAVRAVRQWKFSPALSNGKPVSVWVSVPVRFESADSTGPRR